MAIDKHWKNCMFTMKRPHGGNVIKCKSHSSLSDSDRAERRSREMGDAFLSRGRIAIGRRR